jgi:single-stranded-DNA-specific exonuclease
VKPSIKKHRWTVAEPPDPDAVRRLAQEIRVAEPIARILVHRGIDTYDKAKIYFRPTLELLHDPFLLRGMTEAVARVLVALQNNEKVIIYGDYDVDGTNGAAMVYVFLKQLDARVDYYIPDRIKEGYGITQAGIDVAHQQGITLIVAVDCGITAVSQVDYAASLGIDVIICDHHEPGPTLPNASAVLDPLKPGDPYPFKQLCGCGVAYKLLQGLANKIGMSSILSTYLDFVALATTADIVPLVGENRIMTKLGLELINRSPRPGIQALIERSGLLAGRVTSGQVVFVLAPRINAVGRLGDARRAVRLLTSVDPGVASELAEVLEEENRNRRKIDEEAFAEAQQLAESALDVDSDAAIVLHGENWHPGVIGIVASRMVEKYYKPSIMMATVDGVAKGSARSISGFDVYQALKMCEDKLIQFGGHKYAAGLTMELARLEEFREAFNAAVKEMMTEELKTPEIRVDCEISLSELSPQFVRLLREFAPFGPSNMKPTFLARNLEVAGTARIVGRNHLRFRVRQNGALFDAIGFGLGDLLPQVDQGRKDLECVFSVEENDWRGPNGSRRTETIPQLKIRDLR